MYGSSAAVGSSAELLLQRIGGLLSGYGFGYRRAGHFGSPLVGLAWLNTSAAKSTVPL